VTSWIVVVRIIAILVVLAAVPGALWIGGYLPPPATSEAAADAVTSPQLAEEQWRDRMNAICEWERKRSRGLRKAFRQVALPADAILVFRSAVRLGRESLGVIRRLEAPFAYQREARQLKRLIGGEQEDLLALLDALTEGNRRAVARLARQIGRVEERKRGIYADIGVRGCMPSAPTVPKEPETSPV
jgi:hypothetical protein